MLGNQPIIQLQLVKSNGQLLHLTETNLQVEMVLDRFAYSKALKASTLSYTEPASPWDTFHNRGG